MLGCGCLLLILGFIITVSGAACPPLGLIGIFMMGFGWKGILHGLKDDEKK